MLASEEVATVDEAITDISVGKYVAAVLLSGLVTSSTVMIVGLVLTVGAGGSVSSSVLPLDRVIPELGHGSRPAVLDAGILLLFATPLLGVAAAFVEFVRVRDVAFSVITGALLAVLAVGFAVALR